MRRPKTATEKFRLGDRVELSPTGHEYLILRSHFTGRVEGFGKDIFTVRIRRDGRASTESYHMDFWRLKSA